MMTSSALAPTTAPWTWLSTAPEDDDMLLIVIVVCDAAWGDDPPPHPAASSAHSAAAAIAPRRRRPGRPPPADPSSIIANSPTRGSFAPIMGHWTATRRVGAAGRENGRGAAQEAKARGAASAL